ncbi:MAG: hypothetical protein ACUVWX_09610 [Kiritimatiellia bacterium]
MRIHLFEEFVQDPLAICRDLFRFLGVRADFRPDFAIHNAPHRARSATLQRMLVLPPEPLRQLYSRLPCRMRAATHRLAKKIFAANLTRSDKPPLDPQTARGLMQRYESSIRELEKILQRDLSIWREG